MLLAACRAEVAARRREFRATPGFAAHVREVARWLTDPGDPTFGLFLCGRAGNGKTTLLRALKSVYRLWRGTATKSVGRQWPEPGFVLVHAKELAGMARAEASNPGRGDAKAERYKTLRDIEVLAIDDLGIEPVEANAYGNVVQAVTDVLAHRYDGQLCTLATSNLDASEIAGRYDERVADRMREMMRVVNFGQDASFRASFDR